MTDLTLHEAAAIFDPPITAYQLRQILTALRWQPTGNRPTGRSGRRPPTYDYEQLSRLHAALAPWLTN